MKIWLIQRSEPTHHDNGGAQRLMRTGNMANVFSRMGHEVLWWTSTFDHYNRKQRYATDTCKKVNANLSIFYLKGCGYARNISIKRLIENKIVALKFRKYSKKAVTVPDIIVVSFPTVELAVEAMKYSKAFNVPLVVDIRDLWPDVFLDVVDSRYQKFLELFMFPFKRDNRKVFAMANAVVGLTEEFVSWALVQGQRDVSNFDKVVPMSYVKEKFLPAAEDAARMFWEKRGVYSSDHRLLVVFFGALGRTNDVGTVIEAARQIEKRNIGDVLFVICGKGEGEKKIRAEIADLSNTIFPGWVNSCQIRRLLEMADVGIAPYIVSENYIQNIPNKPSEYLSGGIPIALSLGKGALYSIIKEHHCGFSYNGDANVLADSLLRLASHREELDSMKENASKLFDDQFNGSKEYEKFCLHLEEICTKTGMEHTSTGDKN